jgi:glycosyltransferase involved in cell wall biosynthesis
LKHREKPTLLLLTSSFPNSPNDETCGYIRDFARSISADFDVLVLAPPDRLAVHWPPDTFNLTRSRSLLPPRFDPFTAGADLNHLASCSLLAMLAALLSVICFFARALVLAFGADAICSHWMVPSGLVGALLSRMLRKPHIVVEHSGALHLLSRMRGGKPISKFIIAGSDRVITVSSDLKRKLVALCPEAIQKVEVIPMGVTVRSGPCSHAAAANEPAHTILFIGRLTEIKGLDVLLKAMSGLDGLRLIVAGDGESRDELENMARALAVDARFVRRIGAAYRGHLLATCDVVVVPSRVLADGRTEGTPVSCLEAMAAGRAVIASKAGGLAEAIVDGKNGLLFDPEDNHSLKEKLVLVLKDESLRLKLGDNARSSCSAYDWARIGPRYGQIIKNALRENDVSENRRIEASRISG